LKAAHPYEEPAFDLYPLGPSRSGEGYGCLGRLETPLGIEALAEKVKQALDVSFLKIAAAPHEPVDRVAVMGGSGGGYVGLARAKGAQVLITGDIGYHQAREAEELGICLIDAGHYGTERPVLQRLAERLEEAARERALKVEFEVLSVETDPWRIMEG
ncbi:MAG: Nif3-like dinuclear metal center hexameric protein, partial [Proteobacteria bacterium]|nr:Nif3-like dinuclear metal center hexameric protein [Pseudomonadota bacterium]